MTDTMPGPYDDDCQGYGRGCGCPECLDAETLVADENGDLT